MRKPDTIQLGKKALGFPYVAEYSDAKTALISSVKYNDANCCGKAIRVSARSNQKARRCLWEVGSLLIAETTKAVTEGRLSDLHNELITQGFDIVKQENIDIFTFIEAKKTSN